MIQKILRSHGDSDVDVCVCVCVKQLVEPRGDSVQRLQQLLQRPASLHKAVPVGLTVLQHDGGRKCQASSQEEQGRWPRLSRGSKGEIASLPGTKCVFKNP